MIDEEATFDAYGYRSEQLSGGSGKPVIVICTWCGNSFARKKKESSGNRFCSRACMGKYESANRQGENHHNYKGGKITLVCIVCGESYEQRRDKADASSYCSNKCKGKDSCGWTIGEKRPPRTLEHRIRLSASKQGVSYDEWDGFLRYAEYCEKFDEACRERVRKKFDRKCFICAKSEEDNGQKLSVHHVDMSKSQGCNDEEWKLVPVCRACHVGMHSVKWKSRIEYLLDNVYDNELF